ncbi:glycosyl hydrolase family 28 protein [Diplocloster modestus]|uniref:Uncharacterized protein n=1 Tax=Diplocloster modestus TaxID=2850322 RepID=A0ABS6KB93_9FIRM|nr:glycosyl hydrolase family 28 protein [Diplocloster modestus]MBU9727790.1 hypothetical protein [Diplocloster modestus]
MNYTVFAEQKEIPIYETNVYPAPYNERIPQEYTIFSIKGRITVRILSEKVIREVCIRPISAGIEFAFTEHEIIFTLDRPLNLSVEINECADNNLLIFTTPKSRGYDLSVYQKVLRYPRGIHEVGKKVIRGNHVAVIFEEGAYVHGKFEFNNCTDLLVCGNGIISGEKYESDEYRIGMDFLGCQDVTVQDVTLVDGRFWCMRVFGCDRVNIDHVKVIGQRLNTDGCDICGSRDVTVENFFARVWDDGLVVKGMDDSDKKNIHVVFPNSTSKMDEAFEKLGDVEHIRFKNCVLWNDTARPMEIGVSLRSDRVHNVVFEDVDVIHSTTGYPVMGIHHGDRAEVSDITFQNIRVEDIPCAQLFDIRMTDSVWSTDRRKGHIRDIYFKNIDLIGKPGLSMLPGPSRIEGFDRDHQVSNIVFENIRLLGKYAVNLKECDINCTKFVENVKVILNAAPEEVKRVSHVEAKLKISPFLWESADGSLPGKGGRYEGHVEMTLKNVSKETAEGETWLQVSPANSVRKQERIRYHLSPGESLRKGFDIELMPGKYFLKAQAREPGFVSDWKYLVLALPLSETENIDEMPSYEIYNYYGNRSEPVQIGICQNHLVIKSKLLRSADMTLYTALPVPVKQQEILFSVEETDFGEAQAVIQGEDGPELAPQIGNPQEITYVFENEPKVKKIVQNKFKKVESGIGRISFSDLGLPDKTEHFWMELQADTDDTTKYRYPFTLFHSVNPQNDAHMFAHVRMIQAEREAGL